MRRALALLLAAPLLGQPMPTKEICHQLLRIPSL